MINVSSLNLPSALVTGVDVQQFKRRYEKKSYIYERNEVEDIGNDDVLVVINESYRKNEGEIVVNCDIGACGSDNYGTGKRK